MRNSELKDESPLHQDVLAALRKEIESMVTTHALSNDPDAWGTATIHEMIAGMHPGLGERIPLAKIKEFTDADELKQYLSDTLVALYEERCKEAEDVAVAQAERVVTLRSIDTHWMDHIDDMAHLREQVAFAGYAQRSAHRIQGPGLPPFPAASGADRFDYRAHAPAGRLPAVPATRAP